MTDISTMHYYMVVTSRALGQHVCQQVAENSYTW